jgi:hypothetical protein
MKTVSDRRKKRSGLVHNRWGMLRASLLMTFLVVMLLIMAVKVAAIDTKSDLAWQQVAQETGGYWQIVDVIPDPISEDDKQKEEIQSGMICATVTNSLSEGSFTQQKKWNNNEKCSYSDHNFNVAATWSRPPERITPDKSLSLQADISKTTSITSSTSTIYSSYTRFGISIDEPDVRCGYATAGGKDVCVMTANARQEYDEKEDCVLEVGSGGSAGQQFALRYCVSGGVNSCGYRYVYEWVEAEEKPADPAPGAVDDPGPEPPKPISGDPGSASSGGGSILGSLAVLGVLGILGVLGVVGVVGAAIAIGIKILGGGGGPAAASAGGPKRGFSQNAPLGQGLPDIFFEGSQFGGPSDNPNISYEHQDDDCRPY